jgi:PAS domain S-box-containing protein
MKNDNAPDKQLSKPRRPTRRKAAEKADKMWAETKLAEELEKFQALYDLAVAMTGERSLDENLSLLVDKSKVLLAADTAYIALRDEESGDVYMHTLSGIKTEAFKSMRLPFGAGLGGKVAITGKGYIVEDYFQEIEPVVHDLVRDEGVISGIAVPVQIGQTNLGVLYVFNRKKTSFSKSDLDTLALLGNLAAVEITHRRVEAKLRKAQEELELRVQERTAELLHSNEQLLMEISQRKRVEEALSQSEERYRRLVEDSFDGIFVHRGGKIEFANSRLYEMLGYEPEELQGADYLVMYPPDYRPLIHERCRARIDGQSVPTQYEVRLQRKDGSAFDAELNARIVRFAGQSAVQVCLRDITERKRVDEALRESEEKYRLVVENAGDAIVVAQNGIVRFVNPRAREIAGYEDGDLKSRPFLDFIHPDDRRMVAQRYVDRLKGEPLRDPYHFRVMAKDGSTIWVEVKAVFINWEGMPATLNFVSDITTKRRIEEELLKIEKLGSISILAGGLAHDFNNILTAIMGNISVAKMYLTAQDRVFDRLSDAEKACLRAQGLTQQLLTFAKGASPVKKLCALSELLQESCQFAIGGSKARCEFSLPPDLWATEIDEGQINQVLHNLVINAEHAMPHGGVVSVSAENTVITEENSLPLQDGKYVKVSIKDRGIGIPEQHLSKIFDPYFTTKHRGSGLGLATSYSIIKNHDGLITVESELGVGTTFDVFLPASPKAISPNKHEPDRLVGGEGKILFMDDEEPIRNLAAEMLSLLGYEVVLAKDGDEALNLYLAAKESAKPFSAVIMDLTVPGGMGGKETIRRLQELDPAVKAIVSSGYSNDPVMAEYEKHGFGGVVVKPFGIKEVSEALKRVI